MIRVNVKAVATVIFVKGWSHVDLVYECTGIILVTRSPFQKLRCEHQKKHFLNRKLIAGSIFFNLEKNKVDFFQVKCF